MIGRLLERRGLCPQRIISSTAVRARTTAAAISEACGHTDKPELCPDLYLAGVEAYVENLTRLPGEVRTVMLVGHNPDVEDLVLALTGQHETMPTAALARIAIDIDRWADLRLKSPGRLLGTWRPKELA